MKHTDARSTFPDALFEKRTVALRRREQWVSFAAIGEAISVHTITGQKWLAWVAAAGIDAAIAGKMRGCTLGQSRSCPSRKRESAPYITVDARPVDDAVCVVARETVPDLIKDGMGVNMPIRPVSLHLRRWSYTLQRPVERAYEQCPAELRSC